MEVGIGASWLGRRRRFVSVGAGGTLDSVGGYGGNYVLCIDMEWNRLAEELSDAVSYEACFAPVLLRQDWLVILGNFLLKCSTIVSDSVTSFWQMYLCLAKDGYPTSWWNLIQW